MYYYDARDEQVRQVPPPSSRRNVSTTNSRNVEVVDLNSYANRKTILGGALGMGLFSSNTEQLVTLIELSKEQWTTVQTIKFWLLIISLTLQVCISKFQLDFSGFWHMSDG